MNQTITIYHGSRMVIRKPAFGMGNPNNDYGLGFYCAREIELAKEWACGEECGGFANQMENNTPKWGRHCTHCMACISGCSARAVEYGKKTAGRNRYYNTKTPKL